MSGSEYPSYTSLLEALQDENYHPVVVMGDGQIAMMLVQECHRLGKPVVVIGNWSSEDARKSSVQAMNHDDYYVDLGANWDISREQGTMVALAEKLKETGGWVTAEWENVPAHLLEFFEERWVRLTPREEAFEIMSDKSKEKEFFEDNGISCTQWCLIDDDETTEQDIQYCIPGFLKSCAGGYDSKWQVYVASTMQLEKSKQVLNQKGMPGPYILEKMVDIAYEMSVVFARDESGKVVIISTQKNHQNGPLITSVSGQWVIDSKIEEQAIGMAIKAAKGLNYTGTGTIEFFVTPDGQLLANEMAPRPHNSGHQTIESHEVNQYTTQALIASMWNAISAILDGRIDGISPDSLKSESIDEEMYYRAQPKHPDMITVLVNVVGNRKNWEFPENAITRPPWWPHPGGTLGSPVTTWYGKPGDKNTKHGHVVVTGTKEEVRARVKELLEHCYPAEHARYFAAFENNLPLAA